MLVSMKVSVDLTPKFMYRVLSENCFCIRHVPLALKKIKMRKNLIYSTFSAFVLINDRPPAKNQPKKASTPAGVNPIKLCVVTPFYRN